MRFVTTLKSTFLMLSQYTYLEGSQKSEPEKCQAKYREVTRQNPKAEWRSVLSPKLHYVIWTLRPAHHQLSNITKCQSLLPSVVWQCLTCVIAVRFHIPLLLYPNLTERPTWVYILSDTRNGLPGALLWNDPQICSAIWVIVHYINS